MTHLMVNDVMTEKVATLRESTRFKEIVRILAEKQIGALPVLDNNDNVVGVVSEADLRAKEEAPDLTVSVQDGIVNLSGELKQRSSIPVAVRLTPGLDGVVDVVNRLSFAIDDCRAHAGHSRLR